VDLWLPGTFTPESKSDVELLLPEGKMVWHFRSPCLKIVVATNCTHGDHKGSGITRRHSLYTTGLLKLVGLHVWCCRRHTCSAYRPIVKQSWAGIEAGGIRGRWHASCW